MTYLLWDLLFKYLTNLAIISKTPVMKTLTNNKYYINSRFLFIILLSVIFLSAGIRNHAQKRPEFEKNIFVDSAGTTFVHEKMPIYTFLVPDSDPETKHSIPSPSDHANPLYLDGHGNHYIIHHDPKTGEKTRHKIFADGMPPKSKIEITEGLKIQYENRYYCQDSVIIKINAADNHSGVNKSYYSINNNEFKSYKTPITVNKTEKNKKVSFFSVDNVGNAETPNTASLIFEVDDIIELEKIYFALDCAQLNADAQEQLDKLANSLKNFPEIRIELRSHTDARGSSNYNKILSERRAEATKKYLISKGISPDRLEATGFGDSEIINHCHEGVECTEEEHRENRRTEFRIIPF